MRVCCFHPRPEAAARPGRARSDHAALDAWARALDAEHVTLEAIRTLAPRPEAFDVILVEAQSETLDALRALRAWLGPKSACLLVAHVSRSLPVEAGARAPFREALSNASLVLAPDRGIAADIREKTGILAVALAPPQAAANARTEADGARSSARREQLVVLSGAGYSHFAFMREVGLIAYAWAALRFRLRFFDAESAVQQNTRELRACKFAYLASPLEDGGELAAFCARAGVVLLAPLSYRAARATFPYTAFPSTNSAAHKRRRSLLLLWLYTAPDFVSFFRDTARARLALFSDENRRVQFFRLIQPLAPEHPYVPKLGAPAALWQQIQRRSGPSSRAAGSRSCVVVCLVRNGREHLPSFLRHYRALGVREFVFIDNGSDDGTIELLERDPEVTLYETALSHKDYETEIRRLVIEQHCQRRWCLNVDVDELFDYPMSAELELGGLLSYLEQRGATAMAGHMLDMYDSAQRRWEGRELDLRAAYPNYDVSGLERADYHAAEQLAFCDGNVLLAEIPCFSGGIRQSVFGSRGGARYLLIKHPLIFLDGELEPVTHPHYSNYATVADVTCVLYHYKFTPSFKRKAVESQQSARYVKFAQQQYDRYLEKFGARDSLAIATPGTRRLVSVDELLALGFVRDSAQYRAFVAEYSANRAAACAVESAPSLEQRSEPIARRLASSQSVRAPRAG